MLGFIKYIAKQWAVNANTREAACIAFFTIFSLAPTLIIGVFTLGLFLGEATAQEEILKQVDGLIGAEGAEIVHTILENVTNMKQGILASSVGVLLLLYGASKVFAEMRYAVNKTFGIHVVERPVKSRLFYTLKARLLGLALVLSLGFFIIVSLILSTVVTGVSTWLEGNIPYSIQILDSVTFMFSVLSVGIIFAILLKYLPEAAVKWKHILPAALASAIIFSVGKEMVGQYLGQSTIRSTYGAAGSVIIFLLWVYFSVLVLLLGAEITNALRKFGFLGFRE